MKQLLLLLMATIGLSSNQLLAQSRTITGRVSSQEDGSFIPGVNVLLKGTNLGTISDLEGGYQMSVPSEGGTLIFSFIGLVSQEVEIGNRSIIDIGLHAETKQLSEVVVTAFGIEREKKALGYTVQEVDGAQLAEARSTNVVNGLSGRIAGVQITGNGGPGSASNIVIRGSSSVSGNNQPLIVIDGVPMQQTSALGIDPATGQQTRNDSHFGGGISEINPDNIASITVLKGANAAALYGSRAANGVILITTKTGAGTDGIGVEFNSNMTFERPLVKPNFQNVYGGGNGYRTWYSDGRSGTVDGFRGTDGTDESWGAPMDGRLIRHWWTGTETAPLTPQPNNWDEFWETGQTFTNNIAISGGNDKGHFRLSVGRLDQKGIMYNNDFFRNNFSINSSYKLTEKLTANVYGEYIKSGSDNKSYTGGSEFIWAHRHVSWNQLKNWRDYVDVHIQKEGDNIPAPNWQHTFFTNPFYMQDYLPSSSDKDRLLGNISLNYKFNDNLGLMIRSGTDVWTDTRINVTRFERISNGNFRAGQYSEEILRRQETNSDFIFNFNKTISSDFAVYAQWGGISRSNYFKRNYAQVVDLVIDGLYSLNNNATPNINQSNIEESRVNSLFGAVQFGFKNFLFLDVTGRNDWSSTLPQNNNSFFYPSVSLSAVITDMIDLKSKVLSFAKLRASWAQVGSDADPYQLAMTFVSRPPWNGAIPTFSENQTIANSDLKPEITTGIEYGIDLRFLGGRLGVDATYYSQSTENQILGVEISKTTGYDKRILNAGEITNKGIELMLFGTPIKLTNGFSWEVSVNFAKNRNRVIELAEGLTTYTLHTRQGLSSEARVGEPYGTFYGNSFKKAPDGQLIFHNGLPVEENGQTVLGNIQPDWMGGFMNTFSFKGISISALVDIKMGGDIYDEGTGTARWTGQYAETAIGREEGVIGLGVKNIGNEEQPQYVPNDVIADATQFYGYNNPRRYHEAAIFDASFVKLREATIGYILPSRIFQTMFIKSVKVSAVGRNLAIFHKNTPHIDPEVDGNGGNRQGFTYGSLPSSRSVGFNLNLTF